MAKRLKKEDLLLYSYGVLYDSWPHTTRKLGLLEDAIPKPDIELIKKGSEYESGIIKIEYSVALKAYNDKKFSFENLEVKYEDFLEDTVIHESVHHVQDSFYNIEDDEYDCVTEGLADLISLEIMLEKGKYNIVAWEVIDYFMEMKREYKDYLGLPDIHNQLIKKVIQEGNYKLKKRNLSYAKGFFYICEKYGKMNNYLGLLIEPFKDSEMGC